MYQLIWFCIFWLSMFRAVKICFSALRVGAQVNPMPIGRCATSPAWKPFKSKSSLEEHSAGLRRLYSRYVDKSEEEGKLFLLKRAQNSLVVLHEQLHAKAIKSGELWPQQCASTPASKPFKSKSSLEEHSAGLRLYSRYVDKSEEEEKLKHYSLLKKKIQNSFVASQLHAKAIKSGDPYLLEEIRWFRTQEKLKFLHYSIGKKIQNKFASQLHAKAIVSSDPYLLQEIRLFRTQEMLKRGHYPYFRFGPKIQNNFLCQRHAQAIVRAQIHFLKDLRIFLHLQIWHSALSSFGDDVDKYSYAQQFHAKLLRIGGCNAAQDIMVSTIISSYGQSGTISKADMVFCHMNAQGFSSHNSLVWSCAINYPSEAVTEFYELSKWFRPSESTIQAALFACDHGGLYDEAMDIVDFLEDKFNINRSRLTIGQLNSIVCMLLRGGDFEQAMKLIANIGPELNQVFINSVFGLCTTDEEAQRFVNFLAQNNIRYTILPHQKRVFPQVIWINASLAKQRKGVSFLSET